MDYSNWIKRANDACDLLDKNSEFFLKDLFKGTEWKSLSVGERLSLGRCFKNEVLEKRIPNITYIGKAKNNSAMYQKI